MNKWVAVVVLALSVLTSAMALKAAMRDAGGPMPRLADAGGPMPRLADAGGPMPRLADAGGPMPR